MTHFLRHVFLPHHTNNYRAKILHHSSLFSLIAVLFISNFPLSFVERQFQDVLGISANISAEELLLHTNIKRQEQGLPPLSLNTQLSQAAAGKAQDMLGKDYWAHVAPDGLTPWAFIKGAGYEYRHAGENLARGFTTSGDVVNAWMASPGHRDNMLSPNYTEVGFAVVTGTLTGEETVLVVEMLGSRTTVAESPETTAEVASAPTPTLIPAIQATPTPFIIQEVIPTPTLIPAPTSIPSPTPRLANLEEPTIRVAAVYSEPIIDRSSMNRSIGLFLAGLIFAVLVVDMFFVRRKKILRAISHHLDQIIFFGVLLAIILVVTKGSIL